MFNPCPKNNNKSAAQIIAPPIIGPAISFTVDAIAPPARPTAHKRMYDTTSENTFTTPNKRETIFFAWIKVNHFISSSKVSDFEIDENTFEIGGKNKTRKQLSSIDAEKAYVVKDGIEYSFQHTIPLWMFGFIY